MEDTTITTTATITKSFSEKQEEISEIGLHAFMNSCDERITWKHFSLHSAEPFFSLHNPLSNYQLELLLRMEQNPKTQGLPQSRLLTACPAAGESKEEGAKPEDLINLLIMWGEAFSLLLSYRHLSPKGLFKEIKVGNRSPCVNLNLGEGFIDRKLETSIYPVSHLLLRPVLRADQHEPTIAALQSTRAVYYSRCGRELRALSWALDCYCTAEDQDKRKVVGFGAFFFKEEYLNK